MRTLLVLLLVIGFGIGVFVLASGLAMVVIGAVGHIFNVALFTQISLGQSMVIGLVYGAFGFGAASN